MRTARQRKLDLPDLITTMLRAPHTRSSPTYSRYRRRREAGGADATHLAYPRFGLTRCRERAGAPKPSRTRPCFAAP